ncbi:MAG: hypothetical protein ABFD50_04980 [Smithella sp.]
MTKSIHRWPIHGWLGLTLITIFWLLNWLLNGPRTHWGFFPLWLGYCLTVDAIVFFRKNSSLLLRNPGAYIGMFLISIPVWWIFEIINWRTGNWIYLGEENFSPIAFFLFSSLSFSTVIPAVFGTAELASTFNLIQNLKTGPRLVLKRSLFTGMFIAGWIMLALLLIWPRYFFPFVWLSLFFIMEPVNAWKGYKTLIGFPTEGNRRPIAALSAGSLICGFFWEMWNFFSYPKWVYVIPFVGFMKIFEMPILGYAGYIPFSWELFAFYHLILGLCGRRSPVDYI